jgi:cytochrome c-type biogenesis protein CcmH/NrfG
MEVSPTDVGSRWRSAGIVAFQLAVIVPTLAVGAWLLVRSPEDF